jgi:hypothetical protein
MHGCAKRYRDVYDSDEQLAAYLPSLVFTYREIQNWREDSWAADYLRTLLRTRVVVFCGYSLQDPVIHDTFRTVYEEMARIRAPRVDSGGDIPPLNSKTPEHAPAFFFAPAGGGAREFYGMAVLQAATAAVGAPLPEPGAEHPNYLPFHFRSAPEFPNFDETLRWLFHLTLRARQKECLKSDLRRITTLLLGGPRPESELTAVQGAFEASYQLELQAAKGWGNGSGSEDSGSEDSASEDSASEDSASEDSASEDSASEDSASEDSSSKIKIRHAELCGWSDIFHVGLLREFACGDVVRQRQGASLELALMRRQAWYYPAMQDASWTCWGAIVELALREMARHAGAKVTVGDCQRPTVLIQPKGGRTPHAITIQFGGFERIGINARMLGHPRWRVFWELGPEDAPWRRITPPPKEPPPKEPSSDATAPRYFSARDIVRAPDAGLIWRWASRSPSPDEIKDVRLSLGFRSSS